MPQFDDQEWDEDAPTEDELQELLDAEFDDELFDDSDDEEVFDFNSEWDDDWQDDDEPPPLSIFGEKDM